MALFLNADLTRHYDERIYDIWTHKDNESNRTYFTWNMNGFNFYASTPDYSIKEYIYVNYIRDYLVAIVLTLFSIVWLYRKVISNVFNHNSCYSCPSGSALGVRSRPSRGYSSW
jgi:hypothetical protein